MMHTLGAGEDVAKKYNGGDGSQFIGRKGIETDIIRTCGIGRIISIIISLVV
jgi:hypothetical protein